MQASPNTPVVVESKGVSWLVHPDGRIGRLAHSTTYTRTRNGKSSTFTSTFPERDIAPCVDKNGYAEVGVKKGNKRVKERVHRLVALAYVPGHQDGLTVNHIDGNKLNNAADNLEWVSLARNTQHQWETGLVDVRGENSPHAVLTSKRVVYIRRLLAQGISAHTIAIVSGFSDSHICHIRDGKCWPTVTGGRKVAE